MKLGIPQFGGGDLKVNLWLPLGGFGFRGLGFRVTTGF